MRFCRLLFSCGLLLGTLGASAADAQVAIGELSGPGNQAETVRSRLAARLQSDGFEVVPVASVSGDDAAAIAQSTGASAVVTGAIRRRGGRWQARLTLHDASGAEQGSATGASRSLGGLAAQLARRMADDLRGIAGSGSGGAMAEAPGASAERSRLVVGDFTGRGAARIRNQLVRSLNDEYELVARDDLFDAMARHGGDADAAAAAAGELGVRAILEGHVSRAGRRWVLRVKVTDAGTGEEVGDEVFRGRTSGQLASTARRTGARQLADAIGRTQVPAPPEPEVVEEAPGEEGPAVVAGPTPPPRRRGPDLDLPVAIDIALYGRVFHRDLAYNDDLYGLLRGYTLTLGPAIELAMRWFPGAHFTDGFAAHIGVEASYERAFGIDSVPADPDDERVFPTRSQEWMIGLRGRFPYDDHFFSVGVGYGNHYFIIEPSGPAVAGRGNQPEIPRTEYDFLRLQGEARLALVGGLSLTMGLGYRVVFDSGGIQSEVWFPASTVGGIETDLMVGYRLDNGIEIRLGFDYRRYFYAMNVELTSPWIAGGALDQYIGGSLGIAYRH
ncbi:MAG: hypothetical protein CMN30_25505 [Sandaracinus sp.]|nr:hypothetical protein [Sandaracinus sp.]